jgi:hypothetical protein
MKDWQTKCAKYAKKFQQFQDTFLLIRFYKHAYKIKVNKLRLCKITKLVGDSLVVDTKDLPEVRKQK